MRWIVVATFLLGGAFSYECHGIPQPPPPSVDGPGITCTIGPSGGRCA